MGFRKKADFTLWFGTNLNKELAIFSYSNFKFKLLDTHNPELRMIIPIAATIKIEKYLFTPKNVRLYYIDFLQLFYK